MCAAAAGSGAGGNCSVSSWKRIAKYTGRGRSDSAGRLLERTVLAKEVEDICVLLRRNAGVSGWCGSGPGVVAPVLTLARLELRGKSRIGEPGTLLRSGAD